MIILDYQYKIIYKRNNMNDTISINIDQNGDGIIDKTLTSDWQLTPDEFTTGTGIGTGTTGTKATICHTPPGNPSNTRTITIGQPALKAHLDHGDTLGECSAVGQNKKTPPGQVKKNKP